MKYNIGDRVMSDEDPPSLGLVAIVWNDGDICYIENDAAHPLPDTYRNNFSKEERRNR